MLQQIWTEMKETFFPTWQDCPFCQNPLGQSGKSWGRSGLCRNCIQEIEALELDLVQCQRCSKYLRLPKEFLESRKLKDLRLPREHICENCSEQEPLFQGAWNIGPYEGLLRQAIHDLKYKGRRNVAVPLGKMMAQQIWLYGPNSSLMNPWGDLYGAVLIPIPLHADKLYSRNFNQSYLLAKSIAEETALPVADVLVRKGDTETQAHLGRYERLRNLEGQFELAQGAVLLNKAGQQAKVAILVDDVYTTGATVTEATKVLRQSGVDSVYVVTASAGIGV
ncbi:ComF family protein [Heliorestis acidaminivorans]|uniref:ComF family protein n=1 Tax=Heliorestis acidaminivorans TaxID=553427 RepID=A0A6I0F487_9FIRM|nr:ComF family protein [Heliorestis acidaminivorans]KAB2953642.1 ComF family protein [Heliorestis acidaminivorans]